MGMEARVDPDEALVEFERWVAWQPLAERSAREYRRNVAAFCAWLEATPDASGWGADPLGDAIARDHAVRDFRHFLQVERRAAPATVNLALASLDALYRQRRLGRPNVRRDKPVLAAPRALDVDEQRRLLRAAEHAPVRDRALVVVPLFTALRISEVVALDVDDVQMTTRKGRLIVRSGKGDKPRELPLGAGAPDPRGVADRPTYPRRRRRAIAVHRPRRWATVGPGGGQRDSRRRPPGEAFPVGACVAPHLPDRAGAPGHRSGHGRRGGRPLAVGDHAALDAAVGGRPRAGAGGPDHRFLRRGG
jgi:hypothetical protein